MNVLLGHGVVVVGGASIPARVPEVQENKAPGEWYNGH